MTDRLGIRLFAAGLLAAGAAVTASAQVTSTYVPTGGTFTDRWSDADSWDTADYPDNGQPTAGDTYNAIVNTGTISLDGDFEVEDFTHSGTLSFGGSGESSSLTVNGLFTFTGGYIFARNTINANGGLLITGPDIKRINNSFNSTTSYTAYINNAATGTWDNGHVSGTLILSTTNPQVRSQINNLVSGTFNATAGGFDFAPLFNNHGLMNIDPGAGLDIDFNGGLFNDGTVNVLSGTATAVLTVDDALNPGAGNYHISSGATFVFGGYTGTGHFSGDGDVRMSGAANSAAGGPGTGSFHIGGTTTITWSVALPVGSTTGQLVLDGQQASEYVSGGFQSGNGLAGTLDVAGMTTWTKAGLHGDGTVNANGGVSFVSTSYSHVLYEQVVMNLDGDSTVADGARSIYIEDDAQLNILEDATLTFLNGGALLASKDPGTLHNAGTLHVTNGGTVFANADAVNTGLIIADGFGSNIIFNYHSGSDVPPELRHGLMQQAGELRMLGARITGIESFTGGKLTGFNTNSNVRVGQLTVTAGTISPGLTTGPSDPIGTMYFDNLILEGGAIVEFDLAGTEDDEFDHLLVPVTTPVVNPFGDLQLGGTLVLRFAEGFESLVTETDTFTIIEALESSTGAFANVAAGQRLTTADGLGSFIVNYGASSIYGDMAVVLSDYQAIPEPACLTLMLVSVTLIRRRRVTPS